MWKLAQRALAPAILLYLGIGLTACAGTTRIGTILDDPSEFDGRNVRVRGEVTQSLGAPVVGGAYRIDDGTGVLTIVARGTGTPRRGAEVEVEGIFRSVFNLGDESLSVLEETDRSLP